MTTVSNLGVSPVYPLLQRGGPAPRTAPLDDRVYDPVLDPAVNPALRENSTALDSVTVTAKASEDEGLTFWDFLDLINPLQHIPGVNTIYREMTGDTIKAPIKIIGSTILGGPIGFAAAMADTAIEDATGKDVGEHMVAMLKGDGTAPSAPETMLAAAQPHSASPAIQLASADAREFIPEDPYAGMQVASAEAREFIPEALAAAPRPAKQSASAAKAYASAQALAPAASVTPMRTAAPAVQTPSEAQALVQTAQIAAQANVFPTFKRTGPSAAERAAQAQQTADANSTARYRPLDRTAERPLNAAQRSNGDVTPVSALRARTQFAPGPVNPGGAVLSPASVAVASASQNKVKRAQEAYDYGRNAAASNAPADVPAWFDGAMMDALDKYKAMQQTK